jgi:hypothetical protein
MQNKLPLKSRQAKIPSHDHVCVLHDTNGCKKCIVRLEMTTCKPTMYFPSTMQTLIWVPVLHTAGWAKSNAMEMVKCQY